MQVARARIGLHLREPWMMLSAYEVHANATLRLMCSTGRADGPDPGSYSLASGNCGVNGCRLQGDGERQGEVKCI